jgi:hypothetical protein
MSNRNLMHYFSPNVTIKPPDELTSSLAADDVPRDGVETAVQSVTKRPRTAKISSVAVDDDDDDFENDTILPPQYGNSITKYFSPVDKKAQKALRNDSASPSSWIPPKEGL